MERYEADAVDEINRAYKTEQIVTFWMRNKDGNVSKGKKVNVSELISTLMEKKQDERIVIDYIVSEEFIGSTDLGDIEIKKVKSKDGWVWIADYIKDRDDYDSIAADEIVRMYKRIKELEAVIRKLGA
jgi:hypothetical protein